MPPLRFLGHLARSLSPQSNLSRLALYCRVEHVGWIKGPARETEMHCEYNFVFTRAIPVGVLRCQSETFGRVAWRVGALKMDCRERETAL